MTVGPDNRSVGEKAESEMGFDAVRGRGVRRPVSVGAGFFVAAGPGARSSGVGRGVLLVVTLAAMVLTPAAAANRSLRVELALVPLPKSMLGMPARSLGLARDSGVISNAKAASNAFSATPTTFKHLGRVTGYELAYGDPFSGAAGITEVATGVERYRTPADAKRGLAFWRKDDAKIVSLKRFGLPVTLERLKAAAVGTRRFAYGTTFRLPNVAAISMVDEQVAVGRYIVDVGVAADSLPAAARLASNLARKLDERLRLALQGRLRGRPVKLLPPLKAGPPAGGPGLSTLALETSDLGQATVVGQGYDKPTTPAVSSYHLAMNPAGAFLDVYQEIFWLPSAVEATVFARLSEAEFAHALAQAFPGASVGFTPIDLSSIGDDAYGGIVQVSKAGVPTIYLAALQLSAGQAVDLVFAGSRSQLQDADVANLAQLAAGRLDVGLGS